MSVLASARPRTAAAATPGTVRFAQVASLLTLFLLAARPSVAQGLTVGHVAALLVLPLWLPVVRRYTGGVLLVVTGLAATVASVWLTIYASADHQTSINLLLQDTILIIGSLVSICVVLWARTLVPTWLIGAVFGAGMLVAVVTHQEVIGFNKGSGGEINPWKFAFAVPLAVLSLGLAERTGRRWVQVLVLVALAATSARLDSRSYFGEFLVAALLVVWQMLPKGRGRPSALRVLVLFGIIAACMYNIGTSLILGGALGAETEARSAAQVQQTGSILVGSRPEMGATAALFLSRPFGFGGGTVGTSADIQTAKAGMIQVGYDPENGYVENFLFGGHIELHSTAGDIWSYSGLAGIGFAVVCAVLLIIVISRGISKRTAGGLLLFLIVQTLWNLLFNPFQSSAPVLVLALGLGLAVRTASSGKHPISPRSGVIVTTPNSKNAIT